MRMSRGSSGAMLLVEYPGSQLSGAHEPLAQKRCFRAVRNGPTLPPGETPTQSYGCVNGSSQLPSSLTSYSYALPAESLQPSANQRVKALSSSGFAPGRQRMELRRDSLAG